MANNQFIFRSPEFNARAFIIFLESEGRSDESIDAILESYKDLRSFYWKGSRSESISKSLQKLSIHSVRSSFTPATSVNNYMLNQYYNAIYHILLYLQQSPSGEMSSFLGHNYDDSIIKSPKAAKKKVTVPVRIPQSTVTYSRGFYIHFDLDKNKELISSMLIGKGVDRKVIPDIISILKKALQKLWFHVNSSYDKFRWYAPNIDKYVEGLRYDSNGQKIKPDDKTKQAIKQLIEFYQIEHPVSTRPDYPNDKDNLSTVELYNQEEDKKPRLIISLELANKERFFEFLKNQQVNHQTKERYTEDVPFPKDTSNDSNRSTFVGQDVTIDTSSVEVYVNGELSSEIKCKVREFTDAYVAYLFFKGEKKYSRSISIDKEVAQEPIRHIRFNESENALDINGKKIAITLQGYDEYIRSVSHRPQKEPSDKPTDSYIGKPSREHKTLITKQTTLTKTDESIEIAIKEPPLPVIEESEPQDEEPISPAVENDGQDIAVPIPVQQESSSPTPSQFAPVTDNRKKKGVLFRVLSRIRMFFFRLIKK